MNDVGKSSQQKSPLINPLDRSELTGIAALNRLSKSWRAHATRRLETNTVEDLTKRLAGRIQGTQGNGSETYPIICRLIRWHRFRMAN
ncbi:3-alpha domain-containing protein [Agrobacterium tumefaciens]|uniref:3-alpha domain-containing protein n=1 Tax=Agrobacterium tumefaciens TaxID=358 RepID=UPI002208CC3A|nr:hypothetical protein FY156_16635 [Agrobacterium tumefaciens]